jgi:pyruvate/2-oxoglutarate dehydrogenase complex dihydrolipoamide acyltransferase (E2) component
LLAVDNPPARRGDDERGVALRDEGGAGPGRRIGPEQVDGARLVGVEAAGVELGEETEGRSGAAAPSSAAPSSAAPSSAAPSSVAVAVVVAAARERAQRRGRTVGVHPEGGEVILALGAQGTHLGPLAAVAIDDPNSVVA